MLSVIVVYIISSVSLAFLILYLPLILGILQEKTKEKMDHFWAKTQEKKQQKKEVSFSLQGAKS